MFSLWLHSSVVNKFYEKQNLKKQEIKMTSSVNALLIKKIEYIHYVEAAVSLKSLNTSYIFPISHT